MKTGQFVSTFFYGLGIITRIENDRYLVKYSDDLSNLESFFDLVEIPDNIISFIKDNNFQDYFSLQTLSKGNEYFKENRVKSANINNNTITAIVEGDSKYSLSIIIGKNNIRTSCSCPVHTLCKHSAASFYYLQDKISKLSINEEAEPNNSNSYDDLRKLTNSITSEKELDKFNKIFKILNENIDDDSILKSYLRLVNNLNNIKVRDRIIQMLAFNLKLRDYISSIIYNYSVSFQNTFKAFYRNITLIDYLNKNIRFYRNSEDLIFAYLSNLMYDDLVLKIISSQKYTEYLKYFSLFVDIKNLIFKNEILNNLEEYDPNTLALLYENSNEENKIKILNQNYHFLDLKDINLTDYNIFEELSAVRNINEAFDYVLENKKYLKELNIKKFYILLYKFSSYKKYQKDVIKILEEDNSTIYIRAIIDENVQINEFNPYSFSYFDYSYSFSVDYNHSINKFFFVKFGNHTVLDIALVDDKIKNMTSLFHHNKYSFYYEIINYISSDSEYKIEYNKFYNEIREKIEKEKRLEYLNKLNIFKQDLIQSNTNIVSDFKIGLEYYFSKEESYKYYNNDNDRFYYTLELKICGKKKYIIKNIKEFLDNIRNSNNFKYGKELEFNHNIKNFKDEDIDIIKYLLDIPVKTIDKYSENYRTIKISNTIFDHLLSLLDNRTIYYNDIEYTYSNIEKEIKVTVDYNYKLDFVLEDNTNILESNKIYLVDNNNFSINPIKANTNEMKLISFINDNKKMDISIIKDEFINDIYARFYNMIEISPTIKDEFKLSILRIDSYFDFNSNEEITLDTKLYKDNALITSKMLLSDLDKEKLEEYLNYIKTLGFIDFKVLKDMTKIISFLMMDFTFMKSMSNVYLSESIKNKTIQKFQPPAIKVDYGDNIMSTFLSESSYSEEELSKIMNGIKLKKKYVLLNNDKIIDIRDDTSNEFYEAINELNYDIDHMLESHKIKTIEAIKAYAHENLCTIDDYFKNLIEEISNFKNSDFKLPKINAELRNYQIDGYKWIKILSKYNLGGILADDMGLGKTLEFITALKSDDTLMPSLIICPKSLIFNWYREFEKFDGETQIKIIYGQQSERHKIISNIEQEEKVIYITPYDSLRNDIDLYENIKFNYIIIDEAQTIKNVFAIKSQNVKKLNGNHRFALTGTPIENNVGDLWSIFDFINPGYLDELNNFLHKYQAYPDYQNLISLKIAPFILRRRKEDVLKDLPPKYERILSCEMEPSQRMIYDGHIENAKKKMEESESVFDILPYLIRLRQICINPKLFIDNYFEESSKMIELNKILDEYIENNHRILLFSSFVKALELVEELLVKKNIKYFMLTGDTKIDDRLKLTTEFNENEEIKVFLISLKAGGTGLNLTGADTVIHLDPWWNVSAENQAADRAHRIGQTKNVEIIKLVCLNSIEERVIELQEKKKEVIDKLIAKDDSSISKLSLDDLKFILK